MNKMKKKKRKKNVINWTDQDWLIETHTWAYMCELEKESNY